MYRHLAKEIDVMILLMETGRIVEGVTAAHLLRHSVRVASDNTHVMMAGGDDALARLLRENDQVIAEGRAMLAEISEGPHKCHA